MSKYSIILPVRNGGEYLRECINSILAQTLTDFDFIILENCSTDNTLQIVSSYDDKRIKVFSSSLPLSMEDNWRRVLDVSKNEFMTLIGHDDLLDSTYLQVMDDLISRYPDATLFQSHFRYIDSDGKEIGKCKPMKEKQLPAEVIHNFFHNKTDLMGTGFMMRSRDYDQVGGIPSYPSLLFADMQLFIELSRRSYFAVAQQECFSYRRHSASTTSSSADSRFVDAFEQLIGYLSQLKSKDPILGEVITEESSELLRQYCQSITHKILRTPRQYRHNSSVNDVIEKFRKFAEILGNKSFEPLNYKKIKIGKAIDDSQVLHWLFLGFKRVFPKPFLR